MLRRGSVNRRSTLRLAATVILVRLAFDCWRSWVLALDPVLRTAGEVRGTEPFGHDDFKAEFARMTEYDASALSFNRKCLVLAAISKNGVLRYPIAVTFPL